MKDEVLWRLDFSVSDSYFEECLILRLILAGCQDLLNDAILLSCKQFSDGFFHFRARNVQVSTKIFYGAACQIATYFVIHRITG